MDGSESHTGDLRELVYELLNWRDAQRELKSLIKARYRQWGVLRLDGIKMFSPKGREDYLEQLPAEEERRMIEASLRPARSRPRAMERDVARGGARGWRVLGSAPVSAHPRSGPDGGACL